MDRDELTYRRTLELIERGDSGEAVLAAGRLVETLRASEPAVDPARLADAMTLLARAFAADGDLASAESVARAMSTSFAADGTALGVVLNARARALSGRYLREQGRLDNSLSQLEGTLELLSSSGNPDSDHNSYSNADHNSYSNADSNLGSIAESARVRAELALTYIELEQVSSAIEVAYGLTGPHPELPHGIRRLVAGVCAELGRRAPGADRSADAVLFLQLAVDLLAADTAVDGRRERAALCVELAESLANLGRMDDLQRVCAECFATYRGDRDSETLESAVVAACLDAQTSVTLGRPQAAGALARQLTGLVAEANPHRRELLGRIGLILASVELEINGAAAAERAYSRVIFDLRDSAEPGARLFLAFALDLKCAVLGQLERLDEAGASGRELGELVATFPTHEDFGTVAECGNRTAIRLISRGRPADAARITRAVVKRRLELLDGPQAQVCIRSYVLLCDALRLMDDPAALNGMWHEILELGEPALAVLDGLAVHYRGAPDLRTPLVYTYIGRIGVLARLGREAEARSAVRELFTEFGDDTDPQVRSILSGLRSQTSENSESSENADGFDGSEGPEDPFPDL